MNLSDISVRWILTVELDPELDLGMVLEVPMLTAVVPVEVAARRQVTTAWEAVRVEGEGVVRRKRNDTEIESLNYQETRIKYVVLM